MKNITEKSLFDVFTQHQAYLYRASSRSVNELYKFFNSETMVMLDRLSNLMKELNETERFALAGGEYTTQHLKTSNLLFRTGLIQLILFYWKCLLTRQLLWLYMSQTIWPNYLVRLLKI